MNGSGVMREGRFPRLPGAPVMSTAGNWVMARKSGSSSLQ